MKFVRELHSTPSEQWINKNQWITFEGCPDYSVKFHYDKNRESQMCTVTFEKALFLPNFKKVRSFTFDSDLIFFLLEYE